MKDFFTANLRRIVMLTVLLSVLPAFGVLLFTGMQRYNQVHADVELHGLHTVQSIAERQHLITKNIITILSGLRNISARGEFSTGTASALFKDITDEYPLINNIFTVSSSGRIISSGLPFPPETDFRGTVFLSKAWANQEADVVSAVASPFSNIPVTQYILPLLTDDGAIHAYLGAELRLRFFDSIFAGQSIPAKGSVYIVNDIGMLALASVPEPPVAQGEFIGIRLWDAVRKAPGKDGVVTYVDENDERQLAVYCRLFLGDSTLPYQYVVMVLPDRVAFDLPKAILQRDMLLLAIAAFVTCILGLALCYLGFVRPAKLLLAVAERLTHGNLAARVPVKDCLRGEYAELGSEFNAMAAALEERSGALERERDAASRSSRAKSEFLANMSHEIRTPMNAILGMAHLAGKTRLTKQQQAQLNKINTAAGDLLDLINHILDFSKIEAGKMSVERIPFHLGRLFKTIRASCGQIAAVSGARIVTNIPSDAPPRLVGDPVRLSQALVILTLEALRHCQEHSVELGCLTEEDTGKEAVLHFTVTVHNRSLDADVLANITRCFDGQDASLSRLDNTELSLMLAGSLMRLLGGKAMAENFTGGYRITGVAGLELPKAIFADHVLHFDGERILVLERAPDVREAFKTLFARHNLRAVECGTIEEAEVIMAEADTEGVPFSLVLTDKPPREYDPLQFITRLKLGNGLSRSPQIILSTAGDTAAIPPDFYEHGIDAVLPRPANESLLVDTLSSLLWGRQEQSDAGASLSSSSETPAEECRFDSLTVLLVEDNAVNREIAQEVLQQSGIRVLLAENGSEAVKQCRQMPLEFSLVLMDLEMPGMDGFTATRVLREQDRLSRCRLPIIAMTAHDGAADIEACLEAGMNDHTIKPISLSHLFATIRRWLPPANEFRQQAELDMGLLKKRLQRAYVREAEMLPLVDRLVPYLHEGRVEYLKDCLERHNTTAVLEILDEYLPDTKNGGSGSAEDA